jgi:hypothetical protein
MRSLKPVLLAGVLMMTAACATTTFFNSTWINPETKAVALSGQKIVALMITGEESTRRSVEDNLAKQITARGGQGIAAWTIISTADVRNEEKARAAMTSAGAVAVVTMEVVGQRREVDPVNFRVSMSSGRRSFWGNYHWAWRSSWDTMPQTRTNVWVETLVYSLQPDDLLWAGRTRTVNPSTVTALFAEVTDAAVAEMQRNGLLKPTAR